MSRVWSTPAEKRALINLTEYRPLIEKINPIISQKIEILEAESLNSNSIFRSEDYPLEEVTRLAQYLKEFFSRSLEQNEFLLKDISEALFASAFVLEIFPSHEYIRILSATSTSAEQKVVDVKNQIKFRKFLASLRLETDLQKPVIKPLIINGRKGTGTTMLFLYFP